MLNFKKHNWLRPFLAFGLLLRNKFPTFEEEFEKFQPEFSNILEGIFKSSAQNEFCM